MSSKLVGHGNRRAVLQGERQRDSRTGRGVTRGGRTGTASHLDEEGAGRRGLGAGSAGRRRERGARGQARCPPVGGDGRQWGPQEIK